MNKALVGKILKLRLKYTKKILKEKITKYEPLDFTTAYKELIGLIQDGELKVVKEIPADCKAEWCLHLLVGNFLIQAAYYALGENYIRRRLMNRLGIFEENDIRLMEIVDFIMERLERNRLEKLKKFAGKCQFKTFLSLAAVNLLMDFWRKKYRAGKSATKYETDFDNLFERPVEEPMEVLLKQESEKRKHKAKEILPRILAELETEEKLVYQLKYEMGVKKLGEMARRLGRTRYKTKQLIEQTGTKIKKALIKNEKGGNHEAPGR